MIRYFTSSAIVKELIKNNGVDRFIVEKIIFGQREYVASLESRYLKFVYKFIGKTKFRSIFYNKNINGKCFILSDEEDAARLEKSISTMKKKRMAGEINYHTGPVDISESERVRRSERMKGNTLGGEFERTPEIRKKIGDCAKGNTNVRGYKWWTSEGEYKRAKECPGDSWVLGAKPSTDYQKQRAAEANKNKIVQPETREKLSALVKSRPQNTKGTIYVINSEGVRKRVKPDSIPEGFVSVNYLKEMKLKNDSKEKT